MATEEFNWTPEGNYDNYAFFQDFAPPQPASPAPQPKSEYIPEPLVLQKNNELTESCQNGPAAMYQKYLEFGQLGVLGWCAEFAEMIDDMKQFGHAGNMFTFTRSEALKMCAELLSLLTEKKIHIEMQIIVLYLSSLVARLRKFLDANTEFMDYPQPEFPPEYNLKHFSRPPRP